MRKGGYVLAEAQGTPAVTLLATGSEVALAMRAREALAAEGIGARVVSMPSCSDFDAQDAAVPGRRCCRASVPVLAIEAGVSRFWRAYTGFDGDVIGIDRFGESAPAAQVAEALGLTVNGGHRARARAGTARGAAIVTMVAGPPGAMARCDACRPCCSIWMARCSIPSTPSAAD